MIISSRKRFEETKPYIMEKDRGSEEPTVFGLRLLTPEEGAFFMGIFGQCLETKAGGKEKLNDERYVSTVNRKILAGLGYIKNAKYVPEDGGEEEKIDTLILDTDDAKKKARLFLLGLDEDERTELLTAISKEAALDEGVKKN